MNAKRKIKNAKGKTKSELLIITFAFLIFNFAFSTFADSNNISTATLEGRLAVFDDTWETIRDRYYDPTFNGLDWQAERAKFRPLAARAQTTSELYGVLRRMLGSLHDAHTRVYAPDEKFDWQHPRFISVGISVREVGSAPVVVAVERGSEAERAGLRAGDALISIDDEPALDVFARRLKEQAGSSTLAAARLQAMAKLFEGPRDSTVSLSWLGVDGKLRSATLRREWHEREATLRARRVGEEIGVVEFDAFTQSIAVDFMRALDGKLRGVRGLIIDLRNNGGGDAEAMTEVVSAFLPTGKSLGCFTDRNGRIQFEPHTRAAMLFAPDSIKSFRAPVVILTSERTSSAAEIFAASLREAKRAIIIGQNTCGCVLAIRRRHTLPDGGELDVSEMDYFTATGTRLEGTGLVPDEKITLERQDLRARRDRAIERAIERLQ
ncbi:MAG: carboxyl-terminal processing protease [Acidobacteriota bacterium]|jgi:carboxyl-terminal processing protease|nr:carboxyl-terminal processing protease [Acidobacteriota bacterium]